MEIILDIFITAIRILLITKGERGKDGQFDVK